MYKMTAAHKSLPLPTYVAVRNVSTGREIVVRVNDRGPFHGDRILDLSYAAATKLGIAREGTGLVEVRALDPGSAIRPASGPPPIEPVRAEPIRFFIQVGAFQAAANATKLQASLAGVSRVPVRVRRTNFDDRVMYRVWLGPVSSFQEAERIASVLGVLGIESPRVIVE